MVQKTDAATEHVVHLKSPKGRTNRGFSDFMFLEKKIDIKKTYL